MGGRKLHNLMQTDFWLLVGKKSKFIPSQKIKKRVKYTSKSFRKYFILRSMPSSTQRAWSDQNQPGAIYGSVNSKRPHLPPAFVFFWEKLQIPHNEAGRSWKPHGGALKWGANAPPRDNTKISFSIQNKLQTNANLWEIFNNLIKLAREAPCANRS